MARTYRLASLSTECRRLHLANRGEALASGLLRTVSYVWRDGVRQTALMTPAQAAEHKAWCERNANAVSYRYTRSIITGRFVAA